MGNQCSGQCRALSHATGKVMGIHIGETFKPDQSYEIADFGALLGESS